jgi:hypothetical protein
MKFILNIYDSTAKTKKFNAKAQSRQDTKKKSMLCLKNNLVLVQKSIKFWTKIYKTPLRLRVLAALR